MTIAIAYFTKHITDRIQIRPCFLPWRSDSLHFRPVTAANQADTSDRRWKCVVTHDVSLPR